MRKCDCKVGTILKVDGFVVVDKREGEDPIYDALVDGVRYPISQGFSPIVPKAKSIELRKDDARYALFSGDKRYPYVWVPVRYVR